MMKHTVPFSTADVGYDWFSFLLDFYYYCIPLGSFDDV